MSNQEQNNPYVRNIEAKNEPQPRLEYKTFYGTALGELDNLVSDALNNGWQPAGPQYQSTAGATNGWYLQPMILVPRQMMPR